MPYALIGMVVSKEETGLYIGLINTMSVIAQLGTNFIATSVMTKFHSTALGMTVGGVLSFIAAALVWTLKVKKSDSEETEPLLLDTDQ